MSSPSRPSSQRLLYRGALSLPDSYLLLDGLTFSAQIDAEHNLLENPLALALEMGDITLDINPEAILSMIYFENMFSLPSTSKDRLGVRIALGDSAGPETTQIIVFPKSIPNENDPKRPLCILSVARITPMPVAKPRLPRPDDPTPRKPPLVPFGKTTDLRRKLSNVSAIANLGSDVRLGQKPISEGTFKVPPLPDKSNKPKAKEKDKGKGKAPAVDDVFGPDNSAAGTSGGKRKAEEMPQERENKNHIKQAIAYQLANSLIPKTHPEYKDIFNHVYHGFDLQRADMKVRPIEQHSMERLALMHVEMYTEQSNEPVQSSWVP
ncbi:hypothetical protein BT96DRAFT_1026724 [Gymnopus androsaceus JB14]|uniref:Sld7 C-terminal domain-containing protein n=1 Tax=Gymnopus androsaceus JB14 TaxID=1447944 RepID=A0A6A4GHC4_9AGAR|nr:hypothetical protein BT96DRAFT_1026724 [Gymnopus androsaceus JB14]